MVESVTTTTLLIPTLNELEGMRVIMPRIERSWCEQILFVDGGSTDGTAEWARANGYEVVAQRRKGLRWALFEALEHIHTESIITFSPDGNSVPEAIPPLIAKFRQGYDLVIASRYLPPAKSADDDILTAFGNWLFTKTINVLHGGNLTDSMVMFRMFRKSLVFDLDLHRGESYLRYERLYNTHISWEPLMSVRALKARMRVGEIAADEPARIGGERKLQIWRWGAAYYSQFIRELWFWNV